MVEQVKKRGAGPSPITSGSLLRMLAIALLLIVAPAVNFGQGVIEDNLAPPPLKLLSLDEKTKLGAEAEVKRRTKLALELMDSRLRKAEALHTSQSYDEMFTELGAFHGIMDNMLEFLNKSNKDDNKVLYNFKRLEIGLRGFTPRLEMIHHDVPIRYEQYVRSLIKNVRAARARAIEPLFDDTVLPDKKPGG